MKRGVKRKPAKPREAKPKLLKGTEAFRLQQPIQTALYAKLYRLGYGA